VKETVTLLTKWVAPRSPPEKSDGDCREFVCYLRSASGENNGKWDTQASSRVDRCKRQTV